MITVSICVGSACHLKGSYDMIEAVRSLVLENHLEDKVSLKASFCMEDCTNGCCIQINGKKYRHMTPKIFNTIFHQEVLGHFNQKEA